MSDATASYFAATSEGGFDHQRDAYEQGYEDGAAAARASERDRTIELIRTEAARKRARRPDALDARDARALEDVADLIGGEQ